MAPSHVDLCLEYKLDRFLPAGSTQSLDGGSGTELVSHHFGMCDGTANCFPERPVDHLAIALFGRRHSSHSQINRWNRCPLIWC